MAMAIMTMMRIMERSTKSSLAQPVVLFSEFVRWDDAMQRLSYNFSVMFDDEGEEIKFVHVLHGVVLLLVTNQARRCLLRSNNFTIFLQDWEDYIIWIVVLVKIWVTSWNIHASITIPQNIFL